MSSPLTTQTYRWLADSNAATLCFEYQDYLSFLLTLQDIYQELEEKKERTVEENEVFRQLSHAHRFTEKQLPRLNRLLEEKRRKGFRSSGSFLRGMLYLRDTFELLLNKYEQELREPEV
jgi:hypothetical protein